MSRRSNNPSQRIISRKEPPFAGLNKPQWGPFLLLLFAGNVLVATLAWIIVRLVSGLASPRPGNGAANGDRRARWPVAGRKRRPMGRSLSAGKWLNSAQFAERPLSAKLGSRNATI
jgi:hypothetical protein